PTAVPQATEPPEAEMMAGKKTAPKFADYWNPPTDVYGEPVYGGTLRINYEDPLQHANVWGAGGGGSDRFRNPTMNVLVMEDPYDAAAPLIPDLAEAWINHEDNQGITFLFREGTKWHNGADFICEDARFTFQTWITGEGITASRMKAALSNVDLDGLECEDDLTLTVRYTGPTVTGLLAISDRRAVIFNKEWFLEGGEEAMFQDASVGTGPFIWSEGQEVGFDEQHFERNPDYFIKELPYVDELVTFGILEESTQQAQMLAHQTDWHWVRNFGQYEAYVEHDQIQTVIRATRGHVSLWLNKRNPPFDNVRVRQAVIMGIDRAVAIEILQEGFGSLGFIMAPGSPWELNREKGCAVPGWCVAEDMEAQRAEAKKILEEEGFDFDKIYLFTVESDRQVVNRATLVQEQLRLLGINTDFDLVESVARNQQLTQGTWGDILPRNDTMPKDDPDPGMGQYFRCTSTGNHWMPGLDCDERMEGLLDQVASTIDPVERKRLSDEMQLYAMEQYWKFPIYWEQEAVSFWPEVRGYAHFPAPFGSYRKHMHMWIDPAHKDDKGFKGQTTGIPGGL
ncbi:MAG: ABC transporter substrate-binding protein, partial [Dehalococcoidia bacterium]